LGAARGLAAAPAALGDDAHVDEQRSRYAERRALVVDALGAHGIVHDGGPSTFYLWLRGDEGMDDGWELAARFADAGTLVAPGDLYGPAGADHVRLSLTQPLERLELLVERMEVSAARAS
jgi:aspartate/methionine/tyrosine aminotransferase